MEIHEYDHPDEGQQNRGVGAPRVSTSAEPQGGIGSLSDRARSDMAQAAESAKSEARRIAGQQKEASAATLGEVAGAVHHAARSLEAGMPQMAGYVHDAASKIEDAATSLRTRNVNELMDDLGRFARSQPVLIFGGAMLAGVALTRFLKSSAPDAPPAAPSSSTTTTSYPSSGPSSSSRSGMTDAGSPR